MKPLFIALLFLIAALTIQAADPELSTEAKSDFAWFSTLGYPEIKEAEWAEVWVGEGSKTGNRPVEYRTVPGFIIRQDEDQFEVLTGDLVERELKPQFHAATPIGKVGYEPRSFEKAARQYLDTLKKFALTPEMWAIKNSRLGHRSQIFFMAYAAWRRGHGELAQGLYEQAVNLPARKGGATPPEGLKFRDLLEQEMGRAAMWQAARLFTTNGKPWQQNLKLPTRTQVLSAYMEVVRRFPYCHEAPMAEQFARMLEQMIAEDTHHAVVTVEALIQRPLEEQVRELIFQLRDQTAYQYSLPGAPDIFNPPFSGTETPAHRLAAIGIPAVPQLMAALSDEGFTRASYAYGDLLLTKPTLTVGDCATAILEKIAGRSLRPFRFGTFEDSPTKIDMKLLNAWWQEVQAKGEKQTLMDNLSSGEWPPRELVRVLAAKYPEALEPALLAGLRNTKSQDILDDLVEALKPLNSRAADETLLNLLHQPPVPESKLLAIQKLWDRCHPEALPAALAEFEKLPGSHAAARSYPEMSGYAGFLARCGDSRAIRALQGRWDALPSGIRAAVIIRLPEMLAAKNHGPIRYDGPSLVHRDEASREAALQLLVSALGDASPIIGMVAYGWPKSPRVCDVALSSLHKVEPEVFSFTPKADAAKRDEERAEGLKKWEEKRVPKATRKEVEK